MNNYVIVCFLPFFFTSCSLWVPDAPASGSLINISHLDHLYEEVTIGDKKLGTIWIYCEAPDYRLVADKDEGFTCVDDVARALIFYCRRYPSVPSAEILDKIRTLTEFLLYMQAENGFFYNFLLPGPEVNRSHQNSEAVANWWSWRAFWALSEVSLLEAGELIDLQSRSQHALDTLFEKMEGLCHDLGNPLVFDGVEVPACLTEVGADQMGVMMIGLTNYYTINPSETTMNLLLTFGDLLLKVQHGDSEMWPHFAIMSWRNHWHAWGNSQAYALLYAGRMLNHEPFILAGLNEVRYFYPYCLEKGFVSSFSVVKGGENLLMRDYLPFPQIAYSIRPMVFASLEAFSITGDTSYTAIAGRLASWFVGQNPAGQAIYDPATGRTFDGMGSPKDINRNSGAESTIEALLSLQAIEEVPEALAVMERTKN